MNCETTIQAFDPAKGAYYYSCGLPVKYRVKYKDMRNKEQESLCCGVHRNSLHAWFKRLKKRTNFDSFISEELITNP